MTNCAMKINGRPIINLICLVLCLKVMKPEYTPGNPPTIEIKKKYFSGILQIFFMALLLSIAAITNPAKFNSIDTITIIFII